MASKLREIAEYVKLEHTVFDLPFIFSGAVIASAGNFYPLKYLLILVAGISARGAAMSINRILGRRYDVINPRKRDWALVRGTLSGREAIGITAAFIVLFEISAFLLNALVLLLSPVVLFLFISDPLLKRVVWWRHFYMGLTIGVGVLGGYLAIIPAFPHSPPLYLIFLASALWIAGFDMIYVIPDVESDRKVGLKTVMVRFGVKKGLVISSFTHVASFVLMLIFALLVQSPAMYLVLVPILTLMVIQHRIVDPSRPETIRASFFNANSFIGILFLIGVVFSQVSSI